MALLLRLKCWYLEKLLCCSTENHGCFGPGLTCPGSVLQHYSLISERLECISKGQPVIFDLRRLLTRTVSTQPGSTRKWLSSICLLPLPPRQEVNLRPRGVRCTSWWRGSGRHLRSTDRPAPSAAKATSMCKKNVRTSSCKVSYPCEPSPGLCVTRVLGPCRATSLRFELGETLLYICQGAEDPAHGDLRPQIWREACEWPQATLGSHNAAPLRNTNINVITDCYFPSYPGRDRVRHTEVLRPQNHRYAGQKVLLGPGHNRPVHPRRCSFSVLQTQ